VSVADLPIVQLLLVRVREMRREPGVLFWVFGFPVLLAVALGLAFRNRPPEKQVVAVIRGVHAEAAARAIDHVEGMEARIADGDEARGAAPGQGLLIVDAGPAPRFTLDPRGRARGWRRSRCATLSSATAAAPTGSTRARRRSRRRASATSTSCCPACSA
jgi:hypothetical protein